ncbi:MAG: Crp/Fnr family transcriptional regulator [bacterium]
MISQKIEESVGLSPIKLTAEQLDFIASKGELRKFPKNNVLITEGDISDSMYIIRGGQVKVYVTNGRGKEAVLNIQEEGDFFGELALIDGEERSASVVSLSPVEVILVTRDAFEAALKERPEMAVTFLSSVTQRVRYLTDVVKNMALNDVSGRVCYTLEHLACENEDGQREIHIRLTHKDIANMVGASREMVSRIMRDLVQDGCIRQEGCKTILLKRLVDR